MDRIWVMDVVCALEGTLGYVPSDFGCVNSRFISFVLFLVLPGH